MLQQKCNRRQHKQSHDRNSDSGGAEEICEQPTGCCINSSQFIELSCPSSNTNDS
jgi:hypothetical protein